MIRFIDLKKQYYGLDENEEAPNADDYWDSFAFIDTVIDRFVDVSNNQHWDCWEDFEQDYLDAGGWRNIDLERFKSKVTGKYFRPTEY